MIRTTSAAVRTIWKREYPGCTLHTMDRDYFLPSADFALSQLRDVTAREMPFKPETHDCDDYALILLGRIRERQYTEQWAGPMAAGVAKGRLPDGREHVSVFAVTALGIVWLDCIGHDMTSFRPGWAVM